MCVCVCVYVCDPSGLKYSYLSVVVFKYTEVIYLLSLRTAIVARLDQANIVMS